MGFAAVAHAAREARRRMRACGARWARGAHHARALARGVVAHVLAILGLLRVRARVRVRVRVRARARVRVRVRVRARARVRVSPNLHLTLTLT